MGSPDISAEWREHRLVMGIEFKADPRTGDCELVLDLATDNKQGARVIRVEFLGVSNLALKKFGGGLTQLLCLSLTNIKDRQWDQLSYEINELERGSISFRCGSIQITKRYLLDIDAIEAPGG